MQAVILAGGEGRRLRPYTAVLPKPLMPVGNRPILEIIMVQLKRSGFNRLTMAVGYLAQLLQAYFEDGKRFDLVIEYSFEEKPLGTAGPLSLIRPPENDFLVMNGDILTDLDYGDMMKFHKKSGSIATVAVFQKEVLLSLGVLDVDRDENVVGYTEKPVLTYPVSTGIYCFHPKVLKYLKRAEKFDLPDLIRMLYREEEMVKAYRFDGYWLDIGCPEDYEIALEMIGKGMF